MNKLKAKIANIEVDKSLSLVTLDVGGLEWKSIIINADNTENYLKIGSVIYAIVKETEVVLGKLTEQNISLQNRIPGEITEIQQAKLLAKISLQTNVGKINAIITSKAVNQLELEVGMTVLAMVKTNELMLQK